MELKPKLVEHNILKKIIKSNKVKKNDSVITNLFSYTGNCIVNIIKNYADFIFVLLLLCIILYFRYKNKNIKSNLIQPNEIHVNYIRNKDIVNQNIVNINDEIKSDSKLDDNILSNIKKEINKIDQDNLKPVNLGGLQQFSSY